VRDVGMIGFGSDRIRLSRHFLKQKIQFSASPFIGIHDF
jgi:hypothetical protein